MSVKSQSRGMRTLTTKNMIARPTCLSDMIRNSSGLAWHGKGTHLECLGRCKIPGKKGGWQQPGGHSLPIVLFLMPVDTDWEDMKERKKLVFTRHHFFSIRMNTGMRVIISYIILHVVSSYLYEVYEKREAKYHSAQGWWLVTQQELRKSKETVSWSWSCG